MEIQKNLKTALICLVLDLAVVIIVLLIFTALDVFESHYYETPKVAREEPTHNHEQVERAREREPRIDDILNEN